MKQLKKTILTLALLLAVTTGAWAQGKLIYEKDFSSDAFYPFYLDAADKTGASATVTNGLLVLTNPKVQATNWDVQPEIGRLTSAAPTTQGNTYRVVMQYKTTVAGSVTFALGAQDWSNADWSGQTITVSNDFQTCEAYFNNYPYSNSESHILLQFGELVGTITIKKVEVYELYPFPITWDTTTKTATIASMPAGNVFVVPEYYPQAALTAAPTAINNVPATTDGAIVNAGTVANIGETTTAQGTVMYYVSPTALDDAALLALAADKWTDDVPTAKSLAQGQAYVYYYVRGNDSDIDEENFSDGDILAANAIPVTIAAEPTYAVTFKAANDNTIEAGKATVTVGGTAATVTEGKLTGVKMGSEVKVTAKEGYKFRKVEVKKAGPGPLTYATKEGAVTRIKFNRSGDDYYADFTYSNGSFTRTGGTPGYGFSGSWTMKEENGVLTMTANYNDMNTQWIYFVCTFYVDTNEYSVSNTGDWDISFSGIEVNGTDITSQLTEVK